MRALQLSCAFTLLIASTAAVWPLPKTFTNGSSVLYIDTNVNVIYNSPTTSQHFALDANLPDRSGDKASSRMVQNAIHRTYLTLFTQNYIPWRFYPRGFDFEPDSSGDRKLVTTIILNQRAPEPPNLMKPLDDGKISEAYTLNIQSDGLSTISASSALGLARGLTTFTQLFFKHSSGDIYSNLIPVHIDDAPIFPHRGLNLDVSRTYYPVSDIIRTIDALAYNKFNRLHVHITDAQSWPLVVPSMPSLSRKGAYRPDLVYKPADLHNIQQYGALNGVEVILEIDTPGHTSSVAYSYPDLIAAFNVQPNWPDYANEPPSGTLKLNSSDVYSFLTKLWDDLLPRVSPLTSYFHTGGDEVKYKAYMLDDTVRSQDPNILRPLLQKFVDFNHARIRRAGLIPIVWEEIILSYNLTVGKDVLIQSWQSDDAVASIVRAGHKAIAGNYNYWYLDCGQGQWITFPPGPVSREGWPYLDYCNPKKSWRLIYSYDPLQGVPKDMQHLVLGGEVSMWSEQTDPINVDKMIWPRACAAAEVLWSGAKDASGQNRSQVTGQPRLADMRERLVARGVGSEPVVMPFCSMGNFCVQPS